MLKNNFLKTLMVIVVLMTSFSNYAVPSCMDSLITNPFIKLSLIYFIVFSILNNHSNSLIISLLLLFIFDTEKTPKKSIDESESAEIVLENEITELEKEVNNTKDEISKELEKIESELEDEVIEEEESKIIEESEKLVDQKIKEVINIKSSRGMTDNCEECKFIKNNEYVINSEELSGYNTNEYYNLN